MRIIYSGGCWDLLHAGHVRFLEASRALGDMLIVGVLTDAGAAAYKPRAMAIPQDERLQVVSALRCVDAAFLQPGTDPTPVLLALDAIGLRPQVLTHGSDWTALREGNETLDRLGIRLEILEYGPGRGTTGIVERIRGGALIAELTNGGTHGPMA